MVASIFSLFTFRVLTSGSFGFGGCVACLKLGYAKIAAVTKNNYFLLKKYLLLHSNCLAFFFFLVCFCLLKPAKIL